MTLRKNRVLSGIKEAIQSKLSKGGSEMAKTKLSRSDWLLAVLNASELKQLSPVQIQKLMFLLSEKAKSLVSRSNFYEFEPHNYGPFSKQVYDDLLVLQISGNVRLIPESPSSAYRKYELTSAGEDFAESLITDDKVTAYLSSLVSWVENKSFSDLLRSIYQLFPSYKKNSIFVDQ